MSTGPAKDTYKEHRDIIITMETVSPSHQRLQKRKGKQQWQKDFLGKWTLHAVCVYTNESKISEGISEIMH